LPRKTHSISPGVASAAWPGENFRAMHAAVNEQVLATDAGSLSDEKLVDQVLKDPPFRG
jgi:hypothetical protein